MLSFFFLQRIEKLLRDSRDMLSEYFSLSISGEGMLESIPLLLKDYVPNLDRLPDFLMRLGPQVCENKIFS
jgi:DNA mismatch repair protein MLH1